MNKVVSGKKKHNKKNYENTSNNVKDLRMRNFILQNDII